MAVLVTMDEMALKVNGIQALNKALGHTGALRFLSLMGREPTDYVQISSRLYDGQTVDDIFQRAKATVRKRKRGQSSVK